MEYYWSFCYHSDCFTLPAIIIQIGVRWHLVVQPKHQFNIGFSPTLLFRHDWHELEGYVSDKFFAESVYKKY